MRSTGPFDLHVLSTPPAFVLSQDQTLKSFFLYTQNSLTKSTLSFQRTKNPTAPKNPDSKNLNSSGHPGKCLCPPSLSFGASIKYICTLPPVSYCVLSSLGPSGAAMMNCRYLGLKEQVFILTRSDLFVNPSNDGTKKPKRILKQINQRALIRSTLSVFLELD